MEQFPVFCMHTPSISSVAMLLATALALSCIPLSEALDCGDHGSEFVNSYDQKICRCYANMSTGFWGGPKCNQCAFGWYSSESGCTSFTFQMKLQFSTSINQWIGVNEMVDTLSQLLGISPDVMRVVAIASSYVNGTVPRCYPSYENVNGAVLVNPDVASPSSPQSVCYSLTHHPAEALPPSSLQSLLQGQAAHQDSTVVLMDFEEGVDAGRNHSQYLRNLTVNGKLQRHLSGLVAVSEQYINSTKCAEDHCDCTNTRGACAIVVPDTWDEAVWYHHSNAAQNAWLWLVIVSALGISATILYCLGRTFFHRRAEWYHSQGPLRLPHSLFEPSEICPGIPRNLFEDPEEVPMQSDVTQRTTNTPNNYGSPSKTHI